MIDLTRPDDPETNPTEWLEERMRNERNALLTASDFTQAADDPTGNAAAWATYRQELRDAPANWTPASTWTPPAPPS